MTSDNSLDQLHHQRDYFQKHFPLHIGRKRIDVNSFEVLKNTCPVCGYHTIAIRDVFDICGICFWEDDGQDDFSINENSGPNHMSLAKGREIFFKAKEQLLANDYVPDDFKLVLKEKFLGLDNLIVNNTTNVDAVVCLQNEIIEILDDSNIYGLDCLFNI